MILTNIFLIFQRAKSELEPISVEVKAHDPSWIKEQNMGSFLSVSHGSAENPVFLEMSYNNTGHLILPCHEKSNEFTSEFSWYLRPKIQTTYVFSIPRYLLFGLCHKQISDLQC